MPIPVMRLMKQDVVKVRPTMSIDELDRVLASHEISGAPVVDDDGRVLGVVSQTDIIHLLSDELTASYFYSDDGYRADRPDLTDTLKSIQVADIMERRVHSIRPGQDVQRAAGIMRRLGIHRVLVADDEHRLLGILSALDLMQIIEDAKIFDEFYGLGENQR